MVKKELIEYVKSRKNSGVDDDVIKEELVNNNWADDDIEEVFSKVNSFDPTTPFEVHRKDRDSVFVVDSGQDHPASVAKDDIKIPVGEKPTPVINVIFILFIVISFLLIYKAGVMVAVMGIVNRASYTSGAMYYFLKEFPLYGPVIILFSISASIILYSAFSLKTGSRKSFIFGLLRLLILPTVLSLINYKLMSSVVKYFSISSVDLGRGIPKLSTEAYNIIGGVLNEPVFILSFITLIILLVSHKKFKVQNNRISKKNILTIVLVSLVFIVPSVISVISGYLVVKNDDFGYKKVSSKAGFHIYRPDPMPLGLIYVSNFSSGKDIEGEKNAVHVTYDFSLNEAIDIKQSRPIVLKQAKVGSKFSMEDFVKKVSGGYGKFEIIDLSLAKNNKAYFVDDSLSASGSKSVLILTDENILISISTVLSSKHDLIDIASSLK